MTQLMLNDYGPPPNGDGPPNDYGPPNLHASSEATLQPLLRSLALFVMRRCGHSSVAQSVM